MIRRDHNEPRNYLFTSMRNVMINEQGEPENCSGATDQRNTKDFNTLYKQYYKTVCENVLHICGCAVISEEITQEVFIRIWMNRKHLHEIKDPKAYLFIMSRNLAINHLVKENNYKAFLKDYRQYAFANSFYNPGECAEKELHRVLREGVAQLTPQQQLIYTLKREKGLKRIEIAEKLKLSPLTVKAHMQKALQSVRKFVRERMVA